MGTSGLFQHTYCQQQSLEDWKIYWDRNRQTDVDVLPIYIDQEYMSYRLTSNQAMAF